MYRTELIFELKPSVFRNQYSFDLEYYIPSSDRGQSSIQHSMEYESCRSLVPVRALDFGNGQTIRSAYPDSILSRGLSLFRGMSVNYVASPPTHLLL